MRFATTIDNLFGNVPEVNVFPSTSDYRHSYDDWYLIPKERYSIEPPKVKENIISIPAADGGLDLSEALTGYPVYENREGSFEFYVDNDKILKNYMTGFPGGDIMWQGITTTWYEIYRDICNFLNGRVMYIMLEDDPRWVYHGRFTVGDYDASNGNFSAIKISYVLDPYKLLVWRNDNKWFFDSLYTNELSPLMSAVTNYDDKYALLNRYNDIYVNGTTEAPSVKTFRCGVKPVVPTIHVDLVSASIDDPEFTIKCTNMSVAINYEHTYKASEFEYTESDKEYNGQTYHVKSFDIVDRKIIFIDRLHPSSTSQSGSGDNPSTLTFIGEAFISVSYDIGVL